MTIRRAGRDHHRDHRLEEPHRVAAAARGRPQGAPARHHARAHASWAGSPRSRCGTAWRPRSRTSGRSSGSRRVRVRRNAFLVLVLTGAAGRAGFALAQSVEKSANWVSPSGTRLRMLVDKSTLGGEEVELGEITFAPNADSGDHGPRLDRDLLRPRRRAGARGERQELRAEAGHGRLRAAPGPGPAQGGSPRRPRRSWSGPPEARAAASPRATGSESPSRLPTAGCDQFASRLLRLVRIGEEKLVAVEILDHEQLVAPAAVLDGNATGFELGAQRVERRDGGFARLRARRSGR